MLDTNVMDGAPHVPVAPEPEAMVGYAAAAEYLGVALGTLYAWTHYRRVPHYRIGKRCVRFRLSELAAWIERGAVPAAEQVTP